MILALSLQFVLNIAVDNPFKNKFLYHRELEEAYQLFNKNWINTIPLSIEK